VITRRSVRIDAVFQKVRPFLWPLAFMLFAAALYVTRANVAMPDFDVYHAAATRVLHGESPYQDAGVRPFTYLPAVAIVMLPFALFELDAARFIWFTLSVGLLTAFVRWAVHGLPERRHSDERLQWIAAGLMLPFYTHELTAGQANILLGTLLVGTLLAAQVDLPRVAGVLLGIAIFVKPYALLLLPWLAFAHGRGAAAATTMVMAAGLILPALLFGWTGNVEMLVSWFRTINDTPLGPARLVESVSIGAMWAKWLGLGRFTIFLTLLSTTALLGLVTMVWVHRRTVSDPDYLECALIMLLIPLLSSRSTEYVLLLATPAVICLLDRWGETRMPWRTVAGLALVTMSVGAVGVFGTGFRSFMTGSGVMTVAALGIVLALTHLRWKGLA
jgi:hypothetical protein